MSAFSRMSDRLLHCCSVGWRRSQREGVHVRGKARLGDSPTSRGEDEADARNDDSADQHHRTTQPRRIALRGSQQIVSECHRHGPCEVGTFEAQGTWEPSRLVMKYRLRPALVPAPPQQVGNSLACPRNSVRNHRRRLVEEAKRARVAQDTLQNSVSSHPARRRWVRPRSGWNPPKRSNSRRSKQAQPPNTFRTSARLSACPHSCNRQPSRALVEARPERHLPSAARKARSLRLRLVGIARRRKRRSQSYWGLHRRQERRRIDRSPSLFPCYERRTILMGEGWNRTISGLFLLLQQAADLRLAVNDDDHLEWRS